MDDEQKQIKSLLVFAESFKHKELVQQAQRNCQSLARTLATTRKLMEELDNTIKQIHTLMRRTKPQG